MDPSTWSQGPYRMINGYCVPVGNSRYYDHLFSPPSMSVIHPAIGTLASVVAQTWTIQPPAPDEAGPSNWVERNLQMANLQVSSGMTMEHHYDNFSGNDQENEPPELRSIHNRINDRFITSPALAGDDINASLQPDQEQGLHRDLDPSGEPYSPTSPLQLNLNSSNSDSSNEADWGESQVHRPIVLDLHCAAALFSGKRKRNGTNRAQSVDSYFVFSGTEEQVKKKKRKKRYKEWDSKGGFNIRRSTTTGRISPKTITDLSMARDFGVE